MRSFLSQATIFSTLLPTFLSGCGLSPPRLSEGWEARDISDDMVYNIKKNIICEAIAAIRDVNNTQTSFGPPIPADYGMQLQLTLTVLESTGFTPSGTYNRVYPSAMQSGMPVAQSFNFGLSGDLSSTATRTDVTYSYWQVGSIAGRGKNDKLCSDPVDRRGSSPLLISDLGIERFLLDQVKPNDLLPSSIPKGRGKKPDKIDVYSYDLKFAIVSSLGVNPVFKLVAISGAGMPILNLSRTRTHELLLTFGPTGPDGFKPSDISLSQHLTTQLNSALSRQGGGF